MTPPLLALLALLGCGKVVPPEAGKARSFSLIYTGNLDGEIEPCG